MITIKRLNLFVVLAVLTSLSTACSIRTKILDTAAISMTRGPLGLGEGVRETGSVKGQFCMETFSTGDPQGLLDESVKSAQAKYGVDYILNATFWLKSSCITVEGTGAKLVAAASVPISIPQHVQAVPRTSPKKASPKAVNGKKKSRR